MFRIVVRQVSNYFWEYMFIDYVFGALKPKPWTFRTQLHNGSSMYGSSG